MIRIGIIGAGRFGSSLAEALAKLGVEVLLMDRDQEVVETMASVIAKAVEGNATSVKALNAAGFADCDVVVVAMGSNLEGSVLATLSLKEMKVPRIIARAINDMHATALKRVGADSVVDPNKDMAARIARTLVKPSVLDYVELTKGASILEVIAPPKYIGKTLFESKIRSTYDVTILALRRHKQPDGSMENIISPKANDVIQKGDTLLMFGTDKNLAKLEKAFE